MIDVNRDIIVDALDPTGALQLLQTGKDAALIDVRTSAEWHFVGIPDLQGCHHPLWKIEWQCFPGMVMNPQFLDMFLAHWSREKPSRLLFLCRSGVRSLAAAHAVAGYFSQIARPIHCTNVAEGFEGDPDPSGHRGQRNGWKARSLPWKQS